MGLSAASGWSFSVAVRIISPNTWCLLQFVTRSTSSTRRSGWLYSLSSVLVHSLHHLTVRSECVTTLFDVVGVRSECVLSHMLIGEVTQAVVRSECVRDERQRCSDLSTCEIGSDDVVQIWVCARWQRQHCWDPSACEMRVCSLFFSISIFDVYNYLGKWFKFFFRIRFLIVLIVFGDCCWFIW